MFECMRLSSVDRAPIRPGGLLLKLESKTFDELLILPIPASVLTLTHVASHTHCRCTHTNTLINTALEGRSVVSGSLLAVCWRTHTTIERGEHSSRFLCALVVRVATSTGFAPCMQTSTDRGLDGECLSGAVRGGSHAALLLRYASQLHALATASMSFHAVHLSKQLMTDIPHRQSAAVQWAAVGCSKSQLSDEECAHH
jgi:hypothetical protein